MSSYLTSLSKSPKTSISRTDDSSHSFTRRQECPLHHEHLPCNRHIHNEFGMRSIEEHRSQLAVQIQLSCVCQHIRSRLNSHRHLAYQWSDMCTETMMSTILNSHFWPWDVNVVPSRGFNFLWEKHKYPNQQLLADNTFFFSAVSSYQDIDKSRHQQVDNLPSSSTSSRSHRGKCLHDP